MIPDGQEGTGETTTVPVPRATLYRRAAERVAGLADGEAAEWIAEHGLLSMARWEGLSEGVRERLRERAREIAAYNLYAVSRFRELVDALDDVPVCALKGIHLLGTVYRRDPESRLLSDLDLLVPASRIGEVVARLATLGLEELPVSRRIEGVSPHRIVADERLVVEVHTRLGFKHAARSEWDDVAPRETRLHDRSVFVLDRETTLVHLVAHFVKHRPFSRLGWVEDVLRWTEPGVDGRRALARARDLGAYRSFVAGARVLRAALGPLGLDEVPDRPPRAADRVVIQIHERLLWRDLVVDPWRAGPGSAGGRTLTALLLSDGMTDASGFLRTKVVELLRRR